MSTPSRHDKATSPTGGQDKGRPQSHKLAGRMVLHPRQYDDYQRRYGFTDEQMAKIAIKTVRV